MCSKVLSQNAAATKVYLLAEERIQVALPARFTKRPPTAFPLLGCIATGSALCEYPCPCGYYNDPVKECTCSLSNVLRYQKRISGPLLDRIDIYIEVPRVDHEKLSGDRLGETSEKIRG